MNDNQLRKCTNRATMFVTPLAVVLAATLCRPAPAHAGLKPEIEKRVKKAAVLVFTARSEREKADTPLGSGSGFFINTTGLLMSNNHVVDPTHLKSEEEKFNFHYRGGRLAWLVVTNAGTEDEKTWDAMVLYQNEWADLAVLQVYDTDGNKLKTPDYLRMQPESRLSERMPVWALGFPGGESQRTSKDKHPEVSVTIGHVLDVPRTPGGRVRMVYTDVMARPGNSGGPMVDEDGFLVGAVTLMRKPEDREDTGGANYSALVPAKLAEQLIRYAFLLGKIPSGTDVTPFMQSLTQDDGRLNIPEFKRQRDKDVLFFHDGDRIHGTLATDTITWTSSLGTTEVPAAAIAYVVNNAEGSHLFLEGGNRIESAKVDATFRFQPDGGSPGEYKFADVAVVAFKTAGRSLHSVSGDVIVFDTDVSHLVLSNVEGAAKFESKAGKIDVKLADIFRIERGADGQQVVTLTDGRRMTGKFDATPYTATIAATGTPLRFSLAGISRGFLEVVQTHKGAVQGLGLLGVLANADADVRRIASRLQTENIAGARAALEDVMKSDDFKRMPEVKKEQFRLLDAVCLLREAKYDDAYKALRRVSRATDENVATYAAASAGVLKRFDKGTYEDQPLSDRVTLAAAGQALSNEVISQVRDILRDAKRLEGKSRGEYAKGLADVRKYEDLVKSAAVFAGTDADDELIRLWKHAVSVCQREVRRIEMETGEGQDSSRGRGNPQAGRQLNQRAMDEMRQQREDAIKTAREYMMKLYEYGFRIEDPDVQAMRERKAERSSMDDDNA